MTTGLGSPRRVIPDHVHVLQLVLLDGLTVAGNSCIRFPDIIFRGRVRFPFPRTKDGMRLPPLDCRQLLMVAHSLCLCPCSTSSSACIVSDSIVRT